MTEARRARPLLGTLVQITARARAPIGELHAAITEAFGEIATVHALMSWHDADSELSRINRLAGEQPQPLHPHTRAVLAAALEMARATGGAFDPCVAGTLSQWGMLPSPTDAPQPNAGSDWRDIELSPSGVRFHKPLWIDLGGIAKGYAVDLAVQALERRGVADIVVNAGGDLRVAGPRAHTIAVRHPQHAHALAGEIVLSNEALATSSTFESRRESPRGTVCALVDPATRLPYPGRDSVSVRAPSCVTADALTKVALFAPAALAERVFEHYGASCVRLEPPAG